MKKYAVLKLWIFNNPSFVSSFDEYNDAVQFATLLAKADDCQCVVVESKCVTGSES